MECSSYISEPVCEDTAVSDMAGSDSSRSFAESANLINDCQNNLVEDIMSEVSGLEETEVVAPDFEEMEEMSINSEDRADFAQGASQSEASSDLFSRIENFHFQQSEHLARIKAAGREVTDTYMACESVEVLQEEKLVPSESDNKLLEEMEFEAIQAMLFAELSVTQYSGYGAFHANPLIPQVIEGLEPKVNGNNLTRNWLSNEKNLFEITFYKPFLL